MKQPGRVLIVLVFAAFVSIGLPDALFGTAWPNIRADFGRGNASVGFLQIPGSLTYIASSAMLGSTLRRLGMARLLSLSTAMVGTGLVIYAAAPTFWMIIPAVMLLAGGSGAIDAALNLFAAQRLPHRYMSWLHAFYGIGALVGPFVMAAVYGLGHSWRWGYASIAAVMWMMVLVFVWTHGYWREETPADDEQVEPESSIGGRQVLRIPRVQLSMVMIAMSAIGESLAGLWIASLLLHRFEVSDSLASLGAAAFWVGLTGARILVPILAPTASPLRVLRMSTWVLIAATTMLIPHSLPLSWIAVVLVGIGNASLFPAQMSVAQERFGSAISTHAIGMLISASTAMFAISPSLSGWLADAYSLTAIPLLMLAAAIALLLAQLVLERSDARLAPTAR